MILVDFTQVIESYFQNVALVYGSKLWILKSMLFKNVAQGSFWLALAGSGWLWMALAGSGVFWVALGGSGWFRRLVIPDVVELL